MFGWVEVLVGSRGDFVKSGVFLYTSVELQQKMKYEDLHLVLPNRSLRSLDSCAWQRIVLKDLLVVFHIQDYQVTPRPLLDLAQTRTLHRMICHATLATGLPVSAFKLHRSFALSFSSISLFRSALLGHVLDVPVLD